MVSGEHGQRVPCACQGGRHDNASAPSSCMERPARVAPSGWAGPRGDPWSCSPHGDTGAAGGARAPEAAERAPQADARQARREPQADGQAARQAALHGRLHLRVQAVRPRAHLRGPRQRRGWAAAGPCGGRLRVPRSRCPSARFFQTLRASRRVVPPLQPSASHPPRAPSTACLCPP